MKLATLSNEKIFNPMLKRGLISVTGRCVIGGDALHPELLTKAPTENGCHILNPSELTGHWSGRLVYSSRILDWPPSIGFHEFDYNPEWVAGKF